MKQDNQKSFSYLIHSAAFFLLIFFTAMTVYLGRIDFENLEYLLPFAINLAYLDDIFTIGIAMIQALLVITILMEFGKGRIVQLTFLFSGALLAVLFCSLVFADIFLSAS